MRTALLAFTAVLSAWGAAQQPAPAPKPAAVPSYKDLKFPPLRPIRIPKVETFTLSNGMRVYLLEDHELPLVSGTALVRTGNLFDPPDKVGLAGITGTVIRSGGTAAKTGDQLDEQLENVAARVESSIGETSGSVSFSCLKENAPEVMGVFKEVLTSPEFRQDKIDLIKSQIHSGISRRNDDASGVASREFADTVYGRNTPYGWQMEHATIERISRDDIVQFYRRYYFPANVMLAVWGDISTTEMKSRLEQLFSGWNYQQPKVPPFPAVQPTSSSGIYLAEKDDVTQTFFVLGHLGGELKDKDFPALEVMADILGGGFRSRLVQRVRTQMGAAYSIGASWGAAYDHPGLFEISGSTKSLSTTATLKAVEEEVERIRTQEVSADELATAKETALNSLVFAFDTKTKTLGRMLVYEYYGYPRDFIEQYQKALAAVTRADVLRVAKDHLRPERATVVAVGRPKDFGQPLTALGGPVTPIDLTIPEPKAETTAADARSLERGKQMLARIQAAVGGAEKLAAVKDIVETTDFQIDPSAGGMKVKQVNRWIAPSYFRQDSDPPVGKISAYSDGQTGWISTPQGAGPLAGAQLKQVQGDLFRQYVRLLLSDRISGRVVNAVSDDAVEISDGKGEVARIVFDPRNGLPQKIVYESVHVAGPPVTVEDQFLSFGEFSGLKLPTKIAIVQGGRKFADVTVESYSLNTGLKLEDLNKRP